MKWLLFFLLIPSAHAVPVVHPFFPTEEVPSWALLLLVVLLALLFYAFLSWFNNKTPLIKEGNRYIMGGAALTLSILLVFLLPIYSWLAHPLTHHWLFLPVALLLVFALGVSLYISWKNMFRADARWLRDEQSMQAGAAYLKTQEVIWDKRFNHAVNSISEKEKHQWDYDHLLPKQIARLLKKRIEKVRDMSSPGALTIPRAIHAAETLFALLPSDDTYLKSYEGKELAEEISSTLHELSRRLQETKTEEEQAMDHLLVKLNAARKHLDLSAQEKKELHVLVTSVLERETQLHEELVMFFSDVAHTLEKQKKDFNVDEFVETFKPDLTNLANDTHDLSELAKSVMHHIHLLQRKKGVWKHVLCTVQCFYHSLVVKIRKI